MITWKMILIGAIGIGLGILGNMYVNRLSENRIINSIREELEALKNKRTTADQRRLIELEAQLALLTRNRN